jgi:hypothetical protein
VPVYNNPLGQNIGNIKDQIADMEDTSDDYKWLTILREIFEVAQQVCDMIGTLMQIDAVIDAVKDIFGGLCGTTGHSCTISGEMGQTATTSANEIWDFVKDLYQFCGLFISCRVTQEPREECAGTGGGTWCSVQRTWHSVTSWYADSWASITTDWMQAGGAHFFNSGSFDPKKSIISSTLSLCIPGIILNLEKLRQIHCKKILCYKLDVANGRPVWRCDQEYSYLVCTHFVGQVFAAVPLLQFVSDIGGMIEGIFKNPWGLIGMAIDKACNLICASSSTTGCSVCRGITMVPAIVNIVADLVESTGPRFEAATFDLCEEALKDAPDYNNVAPPVAEGGTAAAGD